MTFFRRLLKEPVVHFIVAGLLLYLLFTLVRGPAPASENDTTIVVDRDTLLTFLQFRSNAFDAAAFEAALDAMSADELQQVIDAYVDEEVLYRESRALNLDESDYIIRQRMVQKMQFLLGDLAGGEVSYTEEELQDYFEENRDAWLVVPSATFTHVFFDAESRGSQQAREDAITLMEEFNERQVGFNDAGGYGDRFPFLKHYVERTFDYLEGQFGLDFVPAFSELTASDQWQGPLPSAYGWHIVLITDKKEARYPSLDEVREDVVQDFLRERGRERLNEITRAVKERYIIDVENLQQDSDR